jgi:hypothetical protein
MQVPKELVVQRIRATGDPDLTARAERDLPEKLDPATDADLLRDFGIDPTTLTDDFDGQSPAVG